MEFHFLPKIIIFILIFSTISKANLVREEKGFISVKISEKGAEFAKNILKEKAIKSIIPIELKEIEKTQKIIFVGNVDILLSNIILYKIDVITSNVELGSDGISFIATGSTADLRMDWKYTYKNWLVLVTDSGDASVKVEDMDVALKVHLMEKDGSLELSLLDSRCDVGHIDIKINGGASWLYQGLVDAFSNHIISAVQDAILQKLSEGISKMASLLQSVPKEIEVDDTSSLNVTFVTDPILTNFSINFIVNGLFVSAHQALHSHNKHQILQASDPCEDAADMIAISLHEDVFNSASMIYYKAGLMNWKVYKLPNQSILKTKEWREVVPQLYEKYPNDDIILNLSVSAPPFLQVLDDEMKGSIHADVIVDVVDDKNVIPVVCLSLVFSASGSAEISQNNLTGTIKLDDLSLSAKWSNIGNLRVDLIEPIIRQILEDVLLPPLSSHLARGFPLPLIRGFTLEDARIVYTDSVITVCSDVAYASESNPHSSGKFNTANYFPFLSVM